MWGWGAEASLGPRPVWPWKATVAAAVKASGETPPLPGLQGRSGVGAGPPTPIPQSSTGSPPRTWELHRVPRSSSHTCRQGALCSRLPPGRRLQAGGVDSPISHAGWHPGEEEPLWPLWLWPSVNTWGWQRLKAARRAWGAGCRGRQVVLSGLPGSFSPISCSPCVTKLFKSVTRLFCM